MCLNSPLLLLQMAELAAQFNTEVVNGVLLNAAAEYTGTYTLRADCTFTAMLNGVPVPIFVGVVADNGKQIRAMSTVPAVQVNYTNTVRVHP